VDLTVLQVLQGCLAPLLHSPSNAIPWRCHSLTLALLLHLQFTTQVKEQRRLAEEEQQYQLYASNPDAGYYSLKHKLPPPPGVLQAQEAWRATAQITALAGSNLCNEKHAFSSSSGSMGCAGFMKQAALISSTSACSPGVFSTGSFGFGASSSTGGFFNFKAGDSFAVGKTQRDAAISGSGRNLGGTTSLVASGK
jgi:hypothetical protein